ncbi:MAG TPA: NAD(P)/FAD-dependent oxidoreductase [Rubrivivax sp.]|jgi:thioredoxin reductase (NADPH)|nr:NAD(P)/FAD-dependent oxidoreductase [Rubrivivax sp.]
MIHTDALIVGAGPVGLFQVFQLGLLEIKCQVVDSLTAAGGQCAELYPDKPIYDIPGLPVCSGQELTDRLLQQIKPFGAGMHFDQEVSAIERLTGDNAGYLVQTSAGTRFATQVIVVAAGAGAFMPRPLKLPGIDAFSGTQLFYKISDTTQFAGQHVVVLGDGDAALQSALDLSQAVAGRPASVTLVHRRKEFRAAPELVKRMHSACTTGELRFVAGQPTGFRLAGERLHELQLMSGDGSEHNLRADALLALMGLSPRLGPINDWGLALERRQVLVDTEKFQTSAPGIFAVGDINSYPGKKKLIVCGFHEATLAAYAAAGHIHPDRAMPLQYTTTSPRLHELLGVATPAQG